MYEVEVKAKLRDRNTVMKKLQDLGCKFSEEIHQVDDVFDPDPEIFLVPMGAVIAVRIREEGGKYVFTYKKDQLSNMDCIEHEVEILNKEEMEKIIKLLGFKYYVQVDKKRIKTKYKDIEVVLDNVKDLGEFIEAEKMTTEEDTEVRKKIPEELLVFLETIGVSRADHVVGGRYDTMLFEKLQGK
jgi:adenylate cyclase class 2